MVLSNIKTQNDKKNSIYLKAILLKALANHHRLLIIQLLSEKSYPVGQLETILGISQSSLSQHLAILRKNKIVKTKRSAQTIFYKLANNDIMPMINRVFESFIQPEPSINIKERAISYNSRNIKPALF